MITGLVRHTRVLEIAGDAIGVGAGQAAFGKLEMKKSAELKIKAFLKGKI